MFEVPYQEIFCVHVRGEDDYRMVTTDILDAIAHCSELLNCGYNASIRKLN